MKAIFRVLFVSVVAFCFLVCNSVFAQKSKSFSGVIVYQISYPEMDLDPAMAGQLPTSMTVMIKDEKMKSEMNMGMVSQTTIVDKKEKKMVLLMDVMGQKIMNKKEFKDDEGKAPEVKMLDEKKEIAGYVCKKAEVTDDEGNTVIVYFNDELSDIESNIKGIKGILMEYEIKQGQMKMKLTAKSVEKKKIKDTEFMIPSDYKEVTDEELKKMFGGGED